MQTQLLITDHITVTPKVTPVRNRARPSCIRKPQPRTGLWTSTWHEESLDSAWVRWCRLEDFGDVDEKYWFLLEPRADVKLLIIDCLADLMTVMQTYGMHPGVTGMDTLYFHDIDMEHIAQTYDGLHLTEQGNAATHLSLPVDLNGWDCESTLWFRWCFESVRELRHVTTNAC